VPDSVYTYAFLQRPLPPDVPGGWQGPVEFIEVGDLAAAVDSALPWDGLRECDDDLLRAALVHDRVICELFRQQPVLPLQFGTVFVSLDGLRRHLLGNAERYASRIQTLDGMGEYTLKLTPRPFHPELADDQPDRERERLIAELKSRGRLVAGESRRGVERLHLLVAVRSEAELRKQIDQYQVELICWDLDLDGPLPPYHFA